MNQKLNLVSDKDGRLRKELGEISPIRKRDQKEWDGDEIVGGKKIVTPLYLVTTNSRSLCFSPDSLEMFGEGDLEILRRKVREIEIRVRNNLNLIDKRLDENESLNKNVQVLEEKLSRKRESVMDISCNEVLCDSRCLII